MSATDKRAVLAAVLAEIPDENDERYEHRNCQVGECSQAPKGNR